MATALSPTKKLNLNDMSSSELEFHKYFCNLEYLKYGIQKGRKYEVKPSGVRVVENENKFSAFISGLATNHQNTLDVISQDKRKLKFIDPNLEELLENSMVRSNQVDFEKLMAESRISDISMQQTIIGTGMKTNNFELHVESINEVDKLYTKEEMYIAKVASRIQEATTAMKMTWNHKEVESRTEEAKLNTKAGIAGKKKQPSKFSGGGMMSRQRGSSNAKNTKAEPDTELEKINESYLEGKREYEEFIDEYYEINKMTLDANQNLMMFLQNPEADEELLDLEVNEDMEDDNPNYTSLNDIGATQLMTRLSSKIPSQQNLNAMEKEIEQKQQPPVKSQTNVKKLISLNKLESNVKAKTMEPAATKGTLNKLPNKLLSTTKLSGPDKGRVNTVSTRFETKRTVNNLASGRTGLTKKSVSPFKAKKKQLKC